MLLGSPIFTFDLYTAALISHTHYLFCNGCGADLQSCRWYATASYSSYEGKLQKRWIHICKVSNTLPTLLNSSPSLSDAILFRSLLNPKELAKLKENLEREDGILQYSYGRGDGHGRVSRMCLWNQPGNDLTGMVGRCKKVAETMELLLEGEVYHYHTKLMMKEAHTGGSFVWHQDYGYVRLTRNRNIFV